VLRYSGRRVAAVVALDLLSVQNYFRDLVLLRYGRVDDDAMEFSNPPTRLAA